MVNMLINRQRLPEYLPMMDFGKVQVVVLQTWLGKFALIAANEGLGFVRDT